MSVITESVPMGPLQLAVCAVVVVCGVAGAVFSARYHARRDAGQLDAVFWDAFAGLVIVFPAVLIPSLASPWLGLATGSLAAFTAVASFVWSPRVLAWQEERLHRAATHQDLDGGGRTSPDGAGPMAALRARSCVLHRLPGHDRRATARNGRPHQSHERGRTPPRRRSRGLPSRRRPAGTCPGAGGSCSRRPRTRESPPPQAAGNTPPGR